MVRIIEAQHEVKSRETHALQRHVADLPNPAPVNPAMQKSLANNVIILFLIWFVLYLLEKLKACNSLPILH